MDGPADLPGDRLGSGGVELAVEVQERQAVTPRSTSRPDRPRERRPARCHVRDPGWRRSRQPVPHGPDRTAPRTVVGAVPALYRRWAAGGAGLLITGNVMVHAEALTGSAGVALDGAAPLEPFTE